jgi:hypothetical protein
MLEGALKLEIEKKQLELGVLLEKVQRLVQTGEKGKLEDLFSKNSTTFLDGLAMYKVLCDMSLYSQDDILNQAVQNPHTPSPLIETVFNLGDCLTKLHVLSNPSLTEAQLQNFSLDPDSTIREHVALHPNTSLNLLLKLLQDDVGEVRSCAAENSNLGRELCVLLSTSADEYIRSGVAANIKTPKGILTKYVNDTESVRSSLAINKTAPKRILDILSTDVSNITRANVALNEKCSTNILKELAKDPESIVRAAVAERTNSSKLLSQLWKDNDEFVRRAVAENTNTSRDILISMLDDADFYVALFAGENLNIR